MQKLPKLLIGLITAGFVTGCDVHSEIADISGGEYMLTETDMKVGVGGVRASVVSSVHSRADDFCSQSGSTSEKISDAFENASVGKFATYTLTFRCKP